MTNPRATNAWAAYLTLTNRWLRCQNCRSDRWLTARHPDLASSARCSDCGSSVAIVSRVVWRARAAGVCVARGFSVRLGPRL